MQVDRVAAIRSKVEAERAIISAMSEKISSARAPWLKAKLQFALNTIGDVESVFLDRLNERRSPEALSTSLDNAEPCLALGIEQRKFVEKIVAAYGSEIEEVG